MRKTWMLAITFSLILLLTGCAGSVDKAPDATAPATQEEAGDAALEEALDTVLSENAEEAAALETAVEASTEVALEESTESEDGKIHLTMYFVDPPSSPYAQGGEKIADLVREATDGLIDIEVVASSTLGERELIEGAMDNEIDIATCANSVLTNYIPQMNILDQAYLWKNEKEAHGAVDGSLGELIKQRALTLGLHVIGFEESGFRNTFSTKPIQSMADFQGVTIRTMENKYHQAAFESFGATPVALPYTKIFEALKEGTVDACENATANCYNSGYYEITPNVTFTNHAFVYIVLCMSDEAWGKIPDQMKDALLAAVGEGVAWERERLTEANVEAVELLKDLGVSFYDIDVTELQKAYQEKAKEKGFFFDPEWQAAVDEAIEKAASEEGAA